MNQSTDDLERKRASIMLRHRILDAEASLEALRAQLCELEKQIANEPEETR